MNNQTRKLSEGAMMIALVGVILLLNRQFANMIEYAMYWVLTFPILIYTAKYGIKYGILTSFCMLLISLMLAAPTTIFYLFCCIVIGVSYGEGVRRNYTNTRLLIMSGSMTFLSYVITTIVFANLFGYNPQDDMEMMHMLLQMTRMDVHGISTQTLLPMIVIIVSIVMSVLQTICIHMLAKLLLKRLKIKTREMKSIFDLHVPKYFGFIIIIIWLLFFARNVLKLNHGNCLK